jgi:hypothetical protein
MPTFSGWDGVSDSFICPVVLHELAQMGSTPHTVNISKPKFMRGYQGEGTFSLTMPEENITNHFKVM